MRNFNRSFDTMMSFMSLASRCGASRTVPSAVASVGARTMSTAGAASRHVAFLPASWRAASALRVRPLTTCVVWRYMYRGRVVAQRVLMV